MIACIVRNNLHIVEGLRLLPTTLRPTTGAFIKRAVVVRELRVEATSLAF